MRERVGGVDVLSSVLIGGRAIRFAETLFLACLVAAPWAYGASPDAVRYALAGSLLLAAAAWTLGLACSGRGLPALALPAVGIPCLALAQLVLGRSAAPIWTVEALLVLAAMLLAACFWSERARDGAAAQRLAFAVMGVCAAQAVFGAIQWSRGPDRIYGRLSPIVTTPFGSYVNHNHFAGLVEMGAVVALGLALGRARQGRALTPATAGLGGVALGLVAAHLASRSRGGLLALTGGLVILGLLFVTTRSSREGARRLGRWVAVAGVALVAFGLAVVPAASRRHLATLLAGPSDLSGQYRVDVAAATLPLAFSRPLLGWGFGAYADAFPEFKQGHGEVRTTHAESDVLEFLAEGGLLGLAAACWLGAGVWGGLRDRLARSRDAARNGLAVGALAAVGALLVHSLVDFNLRLPANALVFTSLLGLASAPREELPALGGRKTSFAVCIVAMGLALAASWHAAGAVRLDRALAASDASARIAALDTVLAEHPYLSEGFRARGLAWRDWPHAAAEGGLGRLMRAERDLRRALALRPRWGEAWADLGWVLYARGDRDGAGQSLARAAALDPTHLGIGQVRAEFFARTAGAPAAVEELRRLRGANPLWSTAHAVALARRWTTDPALLGGLDLAP